MARKPDIVCAGPCGRLIWRGRGCLPEGQAMCNACRRALPPRPKSRTCSVCGASFTRMPGNQSRTCSSACAIERMRKALGKPRQCRDCSVPMLSHMPTPRCPDCVRERNRIKCQRRRDAGRGRTKYDGLTIFDLGDRDGWRCHLCRHRVRRDLAYPHPRSPSFDHLVPVSDGGEDRRENLRLAHLGCNSSRGAGGTVQLMLVG